MHFPPVIPRWLLERTDYLKSFPDLTGSVHTFRGDDKMHARLLALVDAGEDWVEVLEPAEVVLRPAACHPVYPLCTDGPCRPRAGASRCTGWCFRHEPSPDPARMMAFRMHEFVYVGDPEGADAHRDVWVERGTEHAREPRPRHRGGGGQRPLLRAGGPGAGRQPARGGAQARIRDPHHLDGVADGHRLGQPAPGPLRARPSGSQSADGEVAHSACFAVGVDRTALALLHTARARPGAMAGGGPGPAVALSPTVP